MWSLERLPERRKVKQYIACRVRNVRIRHKEWYPQRNEEQGDYEVMKLESRV